MLLKLNLAVTVLLGVTGKRGGIWGNGEKSRRTGSKRKNKNRDWGMSSFSIRFMSLAVRFFFIEKGRTFIDIEFLHPNPSNRGTSERNVNYIDTQ